MPIIFIAKGPHKHRFCELSRDSQNVNLGIIDQRPLPKLIHMWLIDDDKQTFKSNCLSVIHDRSLPDMLF